MFTVFTVFTMFTRRTQHTSVVALATAFLVAPSLGAQAQGAAALRPNAPVERQIAGGGADRYAVQLAKGQVLDATAMQNGIDVVVMVYGPDGRLLDRVDSPNGTSGPERVWLVAPAAGNYRIDVSPLESIAAAGKYTLTLQPVRMASAAARQVLARDRELQRALGDQDNAPLARLLAPNVTWVNMAGGRLDRQGLLAARQAAAGPKVAIAATGVQVQLFGDAAIVSGHEVIADSAGGTAVDREFTRTWVRRTGTWILASSQLAGATQPTRIASADPAMLDRYAGKYPASTDQNATAPAPPAQPTTIVREGDHLVVDGPGGRVPFFAEAPGVFFSNDFRARLIFTPDPNGEGMQLMVLPYTSGGRVTILRKTP